MHQLRQACHLRLNLFWSHGKKILLRRSRYHSPQFLKMFCGLIP